MTSNILSDLSSEIVQEGAIKFTLMSTMGAFSKNKKKTNFCLNLETNFLKVFLLKGTSFIRDFFHIRNVMMPKLV